jgi:Mlc titration factor MtfA (ptsG expression regulator)
VVIHEFAHVIDMVDGQADGIPPLPSAAARAAWQAALMREFDVFSERAVCGHASVIDPYGAQAPEEFFAVASEAFFVAPAALKEEQPALYRLLASFYRQEPAQS